ncbi:MAG: AraC family transcriptional regulator ligand-binding domain-containing protein [Myxococcota bacterium]
MSELLRSVMRGIEVALPPDLDPQAIAVEAGLPALADVPAERADNEAFRRLWRVIMERSGDATTPLVVGANLPLGTYDVIDYLTSASASVGDAVVQLARYFGLITPWFSWSVDAGPDSPVVDLVSKRFGPQENLVFMQYILGVTVGRFKSLTVGGFELVKVELGIPPVGEPACHEAFFGCPVRYAPEAGRSRLVLSRGSWQAPLERSEPRLAEVLERHAKSLLDQLVEDRDGLGQVRIEVQRRLPQGNFTVTDIARSVAVSSRTLQRRLKEAGTTFQTLVDEERSSAARALLADRRLGLEEIAFMLGYSEASAFGRAFKRWTGTSPRDFRQANLGAA